MVVLIFFKTFIPGMYVFFQAFKVKEDGISHRGKSVQEFK